MTNEEKLLREIFGEAEPLWRGKFPISWCDSCNVFSISCPNKNCTMEHKGGSCSCIGCDKCREDWLAFDKVKSVYKHLSKDEREVVYKYERLKRHLHTCLTDGRGLDWEWLAFEGRLSAHDIEIFGLQNLPDMGELDFQI